MLLLCLALTGCATGDKRSRAARSAAAAFERAMADGDRASGCEAPAPGTREELAQEEPCPAALQGLKLSGAREPAQGAVVRSRTLPSSTRTSTWETRTTAAGSAATPTARIASDWGRIRAEGGWGGNLFGCPPPPLLRPDPSAARGGVRGPHDDPLADARGRAVLAEAGMTDGRPLAFVAADLMDDDGWAQAMRGVDHVLHVASPVQPGPVEYEQEVIVPAREGTLRVLRAARNAGIERVVLTSAFHAVSWGHPHTGHVFTEEDWTVIGGPGADAYAKSKTLAERAAWEFVQDPAGAPVRRSCPGSKTATATRNSGASAAHCFSRRSP